MHNGLRTQEALEGTFTRTGFLLVGTEESPCPYSSSEPQRDACVGKQFGIAATRTGKHPTRDFFEPKFKPLFEDVPWVDRLPYRELQPEKPGKGFLTSDYSKRDEFSLAIRMEQHRQQIKHEARVQKEAEQKLVVRRPVGKNPGGVGVGSPQQGGSPHKQAPLLWDIVFAEPKLCIKAKRDTSNPTQLSTERRLGTWKTSSSLAHTVPAPIKPPQLSHSRVAGSP